MSIRRNRGGAPETLEPAVLRTVLCLVSSGVLCPFGRTHLPDALDWELREKMGLYGGGEKPAVSGLMSLESKHTGWRSLSGYRESAGMFLEIVPEKGRGGTCILPAEAEPQKGPGGGFLFRRYRLSAGGRTECPGHGLQADECTGRLAAHLLLRGGNRRDGTAVIRPSSEFTADRIVADIRHCRMLSDVYVREGLVIPLPGLKSVRGFMRLPSGVIPAGMYLWGKPFYRGFGEVLFDGGGSSRIGTRSARKLPALYRLICGLGGTDISVCSDGRLSVRKWDDADGPEKEVRGRVRKIVLPVRTVWPATAYPAVHPAGPVYRLRPGDPFEGMCTNSDEVLL